MFPLRIYLHLGFIYFASLSVFQQYRDMKRKTNKNEKRDKVVNSLTKVFLKNMNTMEIPIILKI